jgi:hypothetical protein
MAEKNKTENKAQKQKVSTKKEAVKKMPNTPFVEIILKKDGKKYRVGRDLAQTLIDKKAAGLA